MMVGLFLEIDKDRSVSGSSVAEVDDNGSVLWRKWIMVGLFLEVGNVGQLLEVL